MFNFDNEKEFGKKGKRNNSFISKGINKKTNKNFLW